MATEKVGGAKKAAIGPPKKRSRGDLRSRAAARPLMDEAELSERQERIGKKRKPFGPAPSDDEATRAARRAPLPEAYVPPTELEDKEG